MHQRAGNRVAQLLGLLDQLLQLSLLLQRAFLSRASVVCRNRARETGG